MQEYPSESDDGGSSEEEDTVCNFLGGGNALCPIDCVIWILYK